jgi:hypothetical protein
VARFYLDENFNYQVADPLRNMGHTVLTSTDLDMDSSWDDEQFFIAVQQQAVLVSFNIKDFRLLHAAWRSWSRYWRLDMPHYGVIILQQRQPAWPAEFLVQELHEVVTRFDMVNQAIESRPSTGWRYVTPYWLLPDPDITT